MTRYQEFERRDGGFLQRAITPDGRIVTGDELCRLIIDHYAQVHNMRPDNPSMPFPSLRINQEMVTQMMRNVKKNKSIAFDGIADSIFQIGKDKCKK
jgi:hypothetical protein